MCWANWSTGTWGTERWTACSRGMRRGPASSAGYWGKSVAAILLHDVQQRLPRLEARELIQEEAHRLFQPVRRVIRAMGRQEHVLEPVEGMPAGQRLPIEHVEGGAPDAVFLERTDERGLVDDRTAAHIHDHGRLFHHGELRRADHAAR